MPHVKAIILALALALSAGVAQAQAVYKCPDGYQDTPCAGGKQIKVTDVPADPATLAARMDSIRQHLSALEAAALEQERQKIAQAERARHQKILDRAHELAVENVELRRRSVEALERIQKYGVATYPVR